jgi:outer membrane receptor protein involved in Fe transport
VYWRFLPRWTLTGGARAYHYDRSARYDATGVYWPSGSLSTSDSTKASGTTFRANLSFKPTDNSLLYAGWSQGFRAGRPQLATSGTLNVCDQNGDGTVDGTNVTLDETRRTHSDAVNNYEVGAKVTLFNRVSIDAALFRTDWADIPVLLAFGGSGVCKDFLYNKNVGAARSEGIELQANVQVTRRLRVDFGGSWLNPRLTQDTPADGFSAGARLPGSPKLNGNLGAEWEFPIGGHEFAIRADGTYLGSFYSNVQQTPLTKTDAYGTLNASARTSFRGLTVDLYAHNLTNGDNFTFRPWFGFIEQYPQWGYRMRPRTVGIQFSEDFRIR